MSSTNRVDLGEHKQVELRRNGGNEIDEMK